MNKPLTEFERLCKENRERADVQRLNNTLKSSDSHKEQFDKAVYQDVVQNLNKRSS